MRRTLLTLAVISLMGVPVGCGSEQEPPQGNGGDGAPSASQPQTAAKSEDAGGSGASASAGPSAPNEDDTAKEAAPSSDSAGNGGDQPPAARFIALAEGEKTVRITVIAAYDSTNGGMNFNGYTKGAATYTVPAGWTVEVVYDNAGDVPHSAVVVEQRMVRRVRVGEPAFNGASTKNPVEGSTSRETFTFTAAEAGEFAIACGFPSHALSGHWLKLNVEEGADAPSLKLPEKPAYQPGS